MSGIGKRFGPPRTQDEKLAALAVTLILWRLAGPTASSGPRATLRTPALSLSTLGGLLLLAFVSVELFLEVCLSVLDSCECPERSLEFPAAGRAGSDTWHRSQVLNYLDSSFLHAVLPLRNWFILFNTPAVRLRNFLSILALSESSLAPGANMVVTQPKQKDEVNDLVLEQIYLAQTTREPDGLTAS